jgi:cation transport protein ChaC
VAHRIIASDVATETKILWRREMPSGAYIPTWVRAHFDCKSVTALTFVNDRSHPRYLGHLTDEQLAQRVAQARGESGTNRDYLYITANCLRELGIHDAGIFELENRVRVLSGQPDGSAAMSATAQEVDEVRVSAGADPGRGRPL